MEAPTNAQKPTINNISAVGIIYPQFNPFRIFIEMKDSGYPRKAFATKLLCIGGNWIGTNAKSDANPRATYVREIYEELCLDRAIASTLELTQLFGDATVNYTVAKADVPATDEDVMDLNTIKASIAKNAAWFDDYLNFVPKTVFDRADPNNTVGDHRSLCSVFAVGLPNDLWIKLERLQKKFGNLSNESITVVTTLSEIVQTGWQTAWGQDRVLQDFFLNKINRKPKPIPRLVCEVENFPIMDSITMTRQAEGGFSSYDQYLARYEVLKRP